MLADCFLVKPFLIFFLAFCFLKAYLIQPIQFYYVSSHLIQMFYSISLLPTWANVDWYA